MSPKPKPVSDRFWSKVKKNNDPKLCWEWQAGLIVGYGAFWLRGKTCKAHRVAWELTNGGIPDGLCVLHECDNPKCVNPNHLFLGTVLINNIDKAQKDRSLFGERNPRAKLSPQDVDDIRRQYARGGLSQAAIAMQYGIDNTQVSRIVRRKQWNRQ